MEVTSPEKLQDYINQTNGLGLDSKETYDIQELTGGTANWVYRVTDSRGQASIVKYAAGHVRNNPSVVFPVVRMDFEARALTRIGELLPQADVVVPAKVFAYDERNRILRISDGGPHNLKEAYKDPELDIKYVGEQMGSWLTKLHSSSTSVDIGDNATAKYIYRFSYNNLAGALEKFGLDRTLGEKINEEFGSLLQKDDGCICHGDFWPGNVLVSKPTKLTIVDWEMSRRGNGATDVGQFAAESWLLDRFRGNRGLLDAFLTVYANERGDGWSMQDRRRVAIHFGTHLSFWPTVAPWGSEKETKECVVFGSEYLEKARNEDWDWLRNSALGILFNLSQLDD